MSKNLANAVQCGPNPFDFCNSIEKKIIKPEPCICPDHLNDLSKVINTLNPKEVTPNQPSIQFHQ
jgi:hypothetical protein